MNIRSKVWSDLIDDVLLPLTDPKLYEKDNLFNEILKDLGAYNSSSAILEKVDNGLCIHIDLPGVLKEDITMDVDEHGIRVKAEFKNGVLKICLPESEAKKSKSVEIK